MNSVDGGETLTAPRAAPPARSNPPHAVLQARLGMRRGGILIPFVILFVVLAVSSGPFLTVPNLLDLFDQNSTVLIVAVTSTLVVISGGVDLSVGAVYALSGLVAAKLTANMDPYLAMSLAVGAGALIGLINGVLVSVVRINALIATLASSYIVSGLATVLAGGTVLIVSNPGFTKLGNAGIGEVKLTTIFAVVIIGLVWILLSASSYGRSLLAVGGNEEAARLSGVRTVWVKVAAYTLSGASAAFAGVLIASRVDSGQADPSSEIDLVFLVLAGVVVGGTSLLGGEGSVWRTCVGILFLALIDNGFVLLSLNSVYEQVIEGTLIILAASGELMRRAARNRSSVSVSPIP